VTDSPNQDELPGLLNVPKLTWAVLLGRWIDFARSALALPEDQAGQRLRHSVPDIIMLQAVWFAITHIKDLDAAQHSVGLDRAEILIDKHTQVLCERFGAEVPPAIQSLLDDVKFQLVVAVKQHRAEGLTAS